MISWSNHAPGASVWEPLLGSLDPTKIPAAPALRSIIWLPAAPEPPAPFPLEAVTALRMALEAKDADLQAHSSTVAEYARLMGRALGWPEEQCRVLYYAGFFHDIGKIGITDAILHKPGRLSAADRRIMIHHPIIGARILSGVPALHEPMLAALCHHELYDGTGYPQGLAGEDIPLMTRVITIVDTFDAMSSSRVYRRARPLPEILDEIRRLSGSHFDPTLTDVFLELVETPTFRDLLARNRRVVLPESRIPTGADWEEPEPWADPDERWRARLSLLADTSRKLNQTTDPAAILAQAVSCARSLLGAEATSAWMLQGEVLTPRATLGWPGDLRDLAVPAGDEDLVGFVTYRHMAVSVPDVSEEVRFQVGAYLHRAGIQAALAVPISLKGRVLGVLAVYFREERACDEADIALLSSLADQTAVALENSELFRATERAINLDPLTGVKNHRFFQETLKRELQEALPDRPVSLILLDVDGFAGFNEAHGYAIGDEVLRLLAQVLQKGLRPGDTVGRHSSDSFAVLLPGLPGETADALARTLQQTVLRTAFPRRELARARLSVSAGVASFPADGTTPRQLMEMAGRRLSKS